MEKVDSDSYLPHNFVYSLRLPENHGKLRELNSKQLEVVRNHAKTLIQAVIDEDPEDATDVALLVGRYSQLSEAVLLEQNRRLNAAPNIR